MHRISAFETLLRRGKKVNSLEGGKGFVYKRRTKGKPMERWLTSEAGCVTTRVEADHRKSLRRQAPSPNGNQKAMKGKVIRHRTCQRARRVETGGTNPDENGPGAAHRRRNCSQGCDGRARDSAKLSANHFLPVADKVCIVRCRQIWGGNTKPTAA